MPDRPLDRRRFLHHLASTGAALAGAGALAAQETPATPEVAPAPPSPSAARYASPVADTGEIPCALCPRGCRVKKGARGQCNAYVHSAEGRLDSVGYGKLAKLRVEPIETDHFLHVLPGAQAVFVGTPSCNLNCTYCNEWRLSQFPIEKMETQGLEPAALADQVAAQGGRLLGFTYTDPAVAIEYAIDVALAARERGVHPIAHTGAYLLPGPMRDYASVLSALNIDLKAYTEPNYKALCQGSLQPVLDAIKAARETPVWLEITYLVVPGYNNVPSVVKDMCKWVADNAGPTTPVHFVRFFPEYRHRQLQTAPADPLQLKAFRETAYEAGLLFAYVGNVPGDTGECTLCPKCSELLIRRIGTAVAAANFDPQRGLCTHCGVHIPGLWE
jgi:pyruvate formate lyase activating enzyme